MGSQHQDRGLDLSLWRQRHMDGHLVTVEVGIERCTDQGMDFDRFPFHQHGFEGLHTQSMQRRGAVQENRMLSDHLLQGLPYLRLTLFYQLLRAVDGGDNAGFEELPEDEVFE